MKRFYLILLLHILCPYALRAEERTLVVYSTNDMHGCIDPFAKIARFIEQERKCQPNVLLLSGGDMFSGNPVVDQYPQRGMPMIELMNRTGYQYAVPGNHEFDYGQQALTACREQAGFELLCANMQVNESVAGITQPHPYAIVKTGGIRIAILGLIETSHRRKDGSQIPSANPAWLEGIRFDDPIETALKYRYLREECDIFIALTHLGADNDMLLAEAMPELDAIIGGHSHTPIKHTRLVNNVLIAQAGEALHYINKVKFTLKDGKITDKESLLIEVNKLKEESPEVNSLIQKYHKEMPLEEVLAEATAQFDGVHPLGSLMADALMHVCETDFAFQNSGGIRIGMLPKGNITMEEVFRTDPFKNKIVVYKMTPQEIRTLLLNSHQRGSQRADLLPAGLRYTLHTCDGKAVRVTLTDMLGAPLNENKRYKVGMNEYIAASYRFERPTDGQEMKKTTDVVLMEYLKQMRQIAPDRQPRATVTEE